MRFSIKTFFNNLRYLGRYNLKTMNQKHILDDNEVIQQAVYEAQSYKVRRAHILNIAESMKQLIESKNSLARFGDGEGMIMNGEDIAFQEYDRKLADRLKEILRNKQECLSVGLNDYYYVVPNLSEVSSNLVKSHHRITIGRQREMINQYIDFSSTYLDAKLSGIQDENDADNARKLWGSAAGGGGDLLLVGAKEAFSSYKYDIFDNARSKNYLFIPNKNAFREYDCILKDICKYNKSIIVILMAGPAACVLASDLAYKGYRALDLGHMAKYYDYYKRGIKIINDEMLKQFFAPDE